MYSAENYSGSDRIRLLDEARKSIKNGLEGGTEQSASGSVSPALEASRACFVTLRIAGQLRGCIGNLLPQGRLIDAVTRNAYLAAFKDPRFEPLSVTEYESLDIEISVLTEPQKLAVSTEQALLEALRPGVDGLIISKADKQATFLPSVWDQLPTPEQFVSHLKLKAGFAADFWDEQLQCSVYQAVKID